MDFTYLNEDIDAELGLGETADEELDRLDDSYGEYSDVETGKGSDPVPRMPAEAEPRPGLFKHIHKMRRGTGLVFPSEFVAPLASDTPSTLFYEGDVCVGSFGGRRYLHRADAGICLFYTDGACLDNGRSNPRAGWGFVWGPPIKPGDTTPYGPAPATYPRVSQGRLELEGPFGNHHSQTSNRAELRAVLGAVRHRVWWAEGHHTIVIATDSEIRCQWRH